ncbi:hypothetical protein [Streptomyces sp. bgisy060]|uniref:hypothetical protein n=1 Tax=Streptomyces sp. bgisy060 TaxID=3413775 RepID=UPI003EBA8764
MTTTPDVTVKNTSELALGDIIRTHGMRVRLDHGSAHTRESGTFYTWTGIVLNLDEAHAQGLAPMSYQRTEVWRPGQGWVTGREAVWAVQGTSHTDWLVEKSS